MFSGAITAIVTPFNKDGSIDYESFGKLIDFQIEDGIDGILPCGSTGESATMSHEEHIEVIKFTVERVNKRVKVMAGTGSNNTAEAVKLSKAADKLGVDGLLLISPYYNKPTQEGLYQHFKTIAEAVSSEVYLYNIPGRTAVTISPDTILRLSEIDNVKGLKAACGNLENIALVKSKVKKDFTILSGDDALTLPMLSIGVEGVISVLTNFAPAKVKEMINAFKANENKKAMEIHFKLLPMMKALFIETNPAPIKQALSMLGFCKPHLRLPLVEMQPESIEKLRKVMKETGFLK